MTVGFVVRLTALLAMAIQCQTGKVCANSLPLVQDSEFSRRVAASELMMAGYSRLSPEGLKAFGSIDAAFVKLGRMPTYQEFMEAEVESAAHITDNDFLTLCWIFGHAQKSTVTAPELAAIIQDWDHELRTADVSYRVRITGGLHDGENVQNRFVIDGSKMLWDRTVLNDKSDDVAKRHVMSYDGISFRDAQGFGRKTLDEWASGRNIVGRIEPLDTRTRFCDTYSPLVLQGILNIHRRFDLEEKSFQQKAESAAVYETPADIDGVSNCVAFGSEYKCYYVSSKYGYSLVAARENAYDFDGASGRVARSRSYVNQDSESLFKTDAGFWLPRTITRLIQNASGSELAEIAITDCKINGAIDPKVFTDVIPNGSLVTEPDRPKAFRISELGDIQQRLDSALTKPSAGRTLLLWLNIAAVLTLVAIILWRHKVRARPNNFGN